MCSSRDHNPPRTQTQCCGQECDDSPQGMGMVRAESLLTVSLIVPSPSSIHALGPTIGQRAGNREGWGLDSPLPPGPRGAHVAQGHDSAQPMKLTSPRTCLNSSSSPWQCGASLAEPQPPTLHPMRGVPRVVASLPLTIAPHPPKDPRLLTWAPRDPPGCSAPQEHGPTVEYSQVGVPSQTGPHGPGGVVQPP